MLSWKEWGISECLLIEPELSKEIAVPSVVYSKNINRKLEVILAKNEESVQLTFQKDELQPEPFTKLFEYAPPFSSVSMIFGNDVKS